MKLLCMRHGQSEYNLLGLCNGDPSVPVNLTGEGRRQARAAGEVLRGVPVERIYCSELPRARQTAEIVNAGLGVEIETVPALNDIRSGCEGRPVSAYFAAIEHDRLGARAGDGETLLEYKARVAGFVERLKTLPCETVLLVAHEETLRVLTVLAKGLPDEAMPGMEFHNCEVVELHLTGGGEDFAPRRT